MNNSLEMALTLFSEVLEMKDSLGIDHPDILRAELNIRQINESLAMKKRHDAEKLQLSTQISNKSNSIN